jgi:hypothetical protein
MALEIVILRQAMHACTDSGCGTVHIEELPRKKMKVE